MSIAIISAMFMVHLRKSPAITGIIITFSAPYINRSGAAGVRFQYKKESS